MNTSPQDLCDLAETLCDGSPNEVRLRAAVSRAYYSAYHSLLPFVTSDLPASTNAAHPKSTTISHEELICRIAEWKSPLRTLKGPAAVLARTLNAARALRVRADYRLDEPIRAGDSALQILRAKKVHRFAESIDQAKAALAKAVEADSGKD